MKYITGIHALNITCSLDTCGDWHQSSLQWENLHLQESKDSLFGDYGIEKGVCIPEHEEKYNVANHIRALLDLLEAGRFSLVQGMNKDFICNDRYTTEIFEQVLRLSNTPHWNQIDHFMGREYYRDWLQFKQRKNHE